MDWNAITLRRDGTGGLYRQLGETLAGAIARGELQPGDRLPSERDLARALGVSRTTAVNAYRELESRGLVRGHVGRGTFVCASPEAAGQGRFAWNGKVALAARRSVDPSLRTIVRAESDPEVISFAAGVTALDCFPAERYRELTERALRRSLSTAIGLTPTEGVPALRRAIASRMQVRPQQVMVVAGAQQGLDLVARCLLDPGDAVIMDRPGYLGAIPVFRALGAHLIGWDIARCDLDELEDLLIRYRPKLLYVSPTFQNPTGRTWPHGLRREVLELTARYRVPIVEDEPYRELWFDRPPPPSLFALDAAGSVIHVGTFAKTLAGGLRLGWVAGAEAVIDQLSLIKQRSDVCSPGLTQLVVADLLDGGDFDRHLTRLRGELALRHRAMVGAIARDLPVGALRTSPVEGGIFLWCRLGAALDAAVLQAAAAAAGVGYVAGDLFYPDAGGGTELRLCFSGNNPARIAAGIRRFAVALDAARERISSFATAEPLV